MRKNSVLLLEIFIWILLLGGLTCFVISTVKTHLDSFNTYEVEFKDVDNLIVGSPVRIMGIDVGHVTNVQPIGNEVYITFKITNKQVYIPADSTVGIQFTGLAGSKSLEINPPHGTGEASAPLQTIDPVRINSLIGLQAEICQTTLETSQSILKMLKMGDVNDFRKNFKDISKSTNNIAYAVKTKKSEVANTRKIITNSLQNGQTSISELNDNVDMFSNVIIANKLNKKSEVLKSTYNIQSFANYVQVQADSRDMLVEETRNIKRNFSAMDKNLSVLKDKKQTNIKIQYANGMLDNLNNFSDFIIGVFKHETLDKMQEQSLKFKNNATKANRSI